MTEIPEEVRAAAYAACYGEPTDIYTWDRVADAVLEAAVPLLAGALVARPDGECQVPEVRYVQSADSAVSGDEIH